VPEYRQRKSPRHPDANYAAEGSYFVTICTWGKVHLFGAVREGLMHLNPAGHMIAQWWAELPRKFPDLWIDCTVVMPNHTHAILVIDRTDAPSDIITALPDAIGWFKTMTTNAYIRSVKADGWPRFDGHLWQGRYHDHIIRDDADLTRIRHYIANNPARWDKDTFNES